jgi:hypothetical protein
MIDIDVQRLVRPCLILLVGFCVKLMNERAMMRINISFENKIENRKLMPTSYFFKKAQVTMFSLLMMITTTYISLSLSQAALLEYRHGENEASTMHSSNMSINF